MSPEPAVDVNIQLTGPPRWHGRQHASRPLAPRDAALLALLAVDGAVPRDRVAAWLWPDTELKNANINLRQHLFKLRRTCGHALVATGPTLRLAPGVAVDIRDAPEQGEGDLLAGLDYAGFGAFEDWLAVARQGVAHRRLDQLIAVAVQRETAHELAEAISLTERLLTEWPLHEHSWRRLMRLHFRRGDRAAAIDAFERCERVMRDEQGSRPSAETLALLDTVERLQPPAAPPPHLPATLLHPPVMAGRDDELQRLHHAWQEGRAALVLGDGGLGKSRLLNELLRQHPQALLVRARPGEAASPYATATLLLREVLQRFRPALDGDTCRELARLLPTLGEPPQSDAVQIMLWRAVEDALGAASACGLAGLVVDDLHQADRASLELLRWLVGSTGVHGLRLAFAARPTEAGPGLSPGEWATVSSRVELIVLQPLAPAPLRALLLSLGLPAYAEGPELETRVAALHRHAGGHPFYTLETLKAMLRQRVDSVLVAAPPMVRAMIDGSLQRLGEPARELAALVALAGGDWDPELGAVVLRRPLLELAGAWTELHEAQMVHGQDLAHDLIRERARDLLPAPWQQVMHGRLALALAARPDVDAARLASHWWAAERWPEAAASFRQAARQAARTGRLAEQEALLDRAAEACARSGDQGGRFDALADAAAVAMMRAGGEAAALRMQGLETLAADAPARARVALLRAEVHLNGGRYAQALSAGQTALGLALPGSDAYHDAQVLFGRALALTGDSDAAIERLGQAAELAAARGRPDQEVSASGGLAHALHAAGRLGEAVVAQRRVLELARARHNLPEIADAANNLASMAYSCGDTRLSIEQGLVADELFRLLGASGIHCLWASVTLARSEAALGRFDRALRRLQVLDTAPAAIAGPTVLALSRVTRAATLLALGRPEVALQDLTVIDPASLPLAQARVLALRGRILQLLGRGIDVERAALQALALQHPGLRDDPVLALDWVSLIDPQDATDLLERLAARARRVGADGLARSLDARRVQALAHVDPAAARTLAQTLCRELPLGLHASTCTADAWLALAAVLRGKAAASCRAEACRWLAQAQLPTPDEAARPAFEAAHRLPPTA